VKNPDHIRIERVKKSYSVFFVSKSLTELIGTYRSLDAAFDAAYAHMDATGINLPIDRC
jgi:hypothetical protein